MERSLDSAAETIKSIFSFNVVRRIFFLASIAASVAVGFGLYEWIQKPIYRPLPYFIDGNNLQSIIQVLDKNHIDYQLNESSHSISVPVTKIQNAKLSLARAGISNDKGFSFSYLNTESKIGGSQFLENARYTRALESDLAKTISDIQGVHAAKVHLAIPQNNIFADENRKPSASVIVHFTPGYENDKEKIRAIIQLIAASVPELDPSKVMITDQYGHDLSAALYSEAFLSHEHFDYQNNLQHYYENKIRSLITPIIGANKASISVNVNLDFTQQEEAREEFDPAQTTVRSEQTINESNGGTGALGVPGALSNLPPTNDNQANQNPQQTPSGQHRTESVKNYEISKSMHYIKRISPKIKDISVAVVVDNEQQFDKEANENIVTPLSKEKLQKLTDLVKSAIGFNQKRGDLVTIVNSSFIPEKIIRPDKKALWQEPWFWEWGKRAVGILLGFVFLFLMYRKFSKDLGIKRPSYPPAILSSGNDSHITPEMMALKEEQLKIIKELVAKEPTKVAGVIKKWIAK